MPLKSFKNIVFSGGGLPIFYSYVGILRLLNEYKILSEIKEFAGTSAGAICATLVSLGYKDKELKELIMHFDYNNVRDIQLLNITETFGLESGNKIDLFVQSLIKYKTGNPKLTFKDHYTLTDKKLYIVATCLSTFETEYFSVDTHPDMPIYLAIRMSISLPVLMKPVIFNEKFYIDGGVTNNIPVNIFRDRAHETLVLCGSDLYVPSKKPTYTFEKYCLNMYKCMYNEWAKLKNKEIFGVSDLSLYVNNHMTDMPDDIGYYVLNIKSFEYSAFSLFIKKKAIYKLYRHGYNIATLLLKYFKPVEQPPQLLLYIMNELNSSVK